MAEYMDVREKLVELLTEFYGCDPMYYGVDALAIAQHLIANGVTVKEWISVKDRLPDEHETLFARYKGTDKWLNGMFMTTSDLVIVCVECENGERIVKTAITKEGVWKIKDSFHQYRVTHWMPLPDPPKGE